MTTLLEREEVVRIGSTVPRIFTPPLPQHCGPDGLPTPEWSWGYDCIDFLQMVCKWKLLPWQKWLYISALEKGENQAGFRFKITVVLVARQNGKTQWLKGLGLWRLFLSRFGRVTPECPGARLAVLAAQNLDYAETTLKDVVDEIRNNRFLCNELINHRVTNGKHRAILTNRRVWRAATASRKGARSLAVDIAMLDELREHTTSDAWNAIVPTTTARPYSQVICTSNAGDQRSEVLRPLRDGAIRRIQTSETAETQIFLAEWSVPQEYDPRDRRYWYMANPAMGMLNDFTIDDLSAFLEAKQFRDMPGFQTEHLCQWVDSMDPGIIPAEHWHETMDPTSRRAEESPVYVGVDVNYERTKSYISIAARRDDGSLHIQVMQAARGLDWVIPWLKERRDLYVGIAVQKTGAPISGLLNDFEAAGLPVVACPTGVELQTACGLLYDGICNHSIFHPPQPILDRAAASGIARTAGDAWIFDRRNSPVDIACLVACAQAVWLEQYTPDAPDPVCHVWPDEEVIKQWELAAAKQDEQAAEQEEQWKTAT
jgi:hypothetical protein